MKKRRHHHVWQYYLKSWETHGRINCLFKDSNKIISTASINLAQERDFYKPYKLSDLELFFVSKITGREDTHPLVKSMQEKWINSHRMIFIAQDYYHSNNFDIPEIKNKIEETIHNNYEDLHENIEKDGIEFIDLIKKNNVSFYKDNVLCAKFMNFIAMQFMRTKKVKNGLIQSNKIIMEKYPKFKIENSCDLISVIFATNIGFSLYSDRKIYKLILLKNLNENMPFVTSDQPVINTLSDYSYPSNTEITDLEIYYPISSSLAVLLAKKESYIDIDEIKVEENLVNHYNQKIVASAYNQIFCSSNTYLASLREK